MIDRCSTLRQEEFSAPLLGRIFETLRGIWAEGRPISPAALQEYLSVEEMSHLTTLLQKPESLAEADRSLPDYINIIQESALKRKGDENSDPLAAAMDKSKEKKGYGGKHNG